jgi:hypothetical protein
MSARFTSMTDIKRANKAAGHHWFDEGTLAFFNSRIYEQVYAGRYFISAEHYDDTVPERYTIRMVNPDGSIGTVGKFQQYDSAHAARDAIRLLEKG